MLGIFVFYRVALSVISWIDKKVPSIELQEGWIRYLIDGPKSVLAIGLVSVLFGIVLLNLEASKEHIGIKLAGVLFTEFGFAFFIAFILHNTIEMHSRVEHDRQISRGIISYLYGVRVDDKMFRAAEEYIFKTAFFRKNLRVEYEFQKELLGKLFIKYTLKTFTRPRSTSAFSSVLNDLTVSFVIMV